MKRLIKAILPKDALAKYHIFLARASSFIYRHPSEKLKVIGVTGTNGKSSVVSYISQLLESLEKKTGYTTTVEFKLGDRIWLNDKKMTMLGRGLLQKMLSDMVKKKTDYAIIETSSEGVSQSRHQGINYDVAVFTNLTPEHLESHGGFENYKKAKQSFFDHTAACPRKTLHNEQVKKRAIINADDQHAIDFVRQGFDETFAHSVEGSALTGITKSINIEEHATSIKGSSFTIQGVAFTTSLFGEFTMENIISAITTVHSLGFSLEDLIEPVKLLKPVPGRLESIDEGQSFGVLVDYAPEIASLEALYETLSLYQYRKLIHVLGSCGGGRDTEKRPTLGAMAGKKADVVIVTNEDPYDEDPASIITAVAEGARKVGKHDGEDLFEVLSRKEGIAKAFSLANPGDLVVITGKGAEQAMVVKNNTKIPWDDRVIARELLSKMCG